MKLLVNLDRYIKNIVINEEPRPNYNINSSIYETNTYDRIGVKNQKQDWLWFNYSKIFRTDYSSYKMA